MLKKVWKKFKGWRNKPVNRMIDDFVKAFPGRCIICSYHAYGVREGLTREPYPKPHDCIEGRKFPSKKGGSA